MVDADHAERLVIALRGQFNRHGWLVEGGCDVVDGDGVVRVCCVRADVADYADASVGGGEGLDVYEWRDLRGEVDAVNEDVGVFDDFFEGAA